MHVVPLHDWMVVKLDPLPGVSKGGIVLPEGTSGMERVRTGKVLRVGPGKWRWSKAERKSVRTPVGVEVGEGVAFFRENLEHQQGKQVTAIIQELEEDTGMIRAADVLYAFHRMDAP